MKCWFDCVCVRLTCASGSTNGDQMGPILCDGLYWELVLAERSLLHDGNRSQRSSLRALDDTTDSTYGGGCNGWDRLHFYCTQKYQNLHMLIESKTNQNNNKKSTTFDLLVLSASILLRFAAHCRSRLSTNSCHGDSWDLVNNMHSLHDRGRANCSRNNGWCGHGIGHRLHGRLRHLALHSDQYWLIAERGACQTVW